MNSVNNKNIKVKIEKKIDEIGQFYNENKAVILTETDLQCLVYQKLLEIDELKKIKNTRNEKNIKTHYVHTEISWFDENGKLTIKPDISLIEPDVLTISDGIKNIKMPAKGFSFTEGGIIFELKLNRYKTSTRFLNEIKKDFAKFKKLLLRNDEIFCYFVVFNKTNYKSIELKRFLEENKSSDKHKIIYKTANIDYR